MGKVGFVDLPSGTVDSGMIKDIEKIEFQSGMVELSGTIGA